MSDQENRSFGDEIRDIVQAAIDQNDFTKLKDFIEDSVDGALDQFDHILNEKEKSEPEKDATFYEQDSDRRDHQELGWDRKTLRKKKVERVKAGVSREAKIWTENFQQSFQQGMDSMRDSIQSARAESNWKNGSYNRDRQSKADRTGSRSGWWQERYASTTSSKTVGLLALILGALFGGCCALADVILLLLAIVTTAVHTPGTMGLWISFFAVLPVTILGLVAAVKGNGLLGLVKRFRRYTGFLGEREYCKLEDLETVCQLPHKKVVKDLEKMMEKGWFLQGAMDPQQSCLMVTNEACYQYQEARRAFEARQEKAERTGWSQTDSYRSGEDHARSAETGRGEAKDLPEEVRGVIEEGRRYLQEIRACNRTIAGGEISLKISRLETLVDRILDRVEDHPELVDELRRFMKYYLPTTVKLLNAYRELDQEPHQGANIVKSKEEIEATLDTINRAFENLLDSFFEDTAIDIRSDISVMETLMAQEGLLREKQSVERTDR